MFETSDPASRKARAARDAAFAKALAEELRAVGAGDKPGGEGLAWMLAVLMAGQPGLDYAQVVERLVLALLVDSGPIIWDHVRASGGQVS